MNCRAGDSGRAGGGRDVAPRTVIGPARRRGRTADADRGRAAEASGWYRSAIAVTLYCVLVGSLPNVR